MEQHTATRQPAILIIDDQPANLAVLANYLDKRGFEVLVARAGETGLEKARFARPDLILLDVAMPGMDGYETCRRLKADPATRAIPVIFITVYTDTEHKLAGFDAGGLDYITKPFQEQEIVARVLTHIRLRELTDTLEAQVNARTRELAIANERLQQEILDRQAAEAQVRGFNAELERRVAERTQALYQANEELDSFAYVVSHDLKAPLRGMNQVVRWLKEDYADRFDAQGQEWLELLSGEAVLLEKMVKGILDYSKVGRSAEARDAIDCNILLKDVIKMLAPPPHLTITIQDQLPVVFGNRVRMMQLFENLLDNAIKFMDQPTDGRIAVRCVPAGAWWQFSVTDNGPGIEPRYHEKIFQVFQTTSPHQRENSGIGLALVKKIVTLYGGRIWVESALGQGSTFFFTLKRQEEQ